MTSAKKYRFGEWIGLQNTVRLRDDIKHRFHIDFPILRHVYFRANRKFPHESLREYFHECKNKIKPQKRIHGTDFSYCPPRLLARM